MYGYNYLRNRFPISFQKKSTSEKDKKQISNSSEKKFADSSHTFTPKHFETSERMPNVIKTKVT